MSENGVKIQLSKQTSNFHRNKKNNATMDDETTSFLADTKLSEAMGADPNERQEGTKLPQYIAALAVSIGAMGCGTVLGWTGNIGQELQHGDFNSIQVSKEQLGWIGSLATLGSMTMCFPIGLICNKIGRKLANLLLVIPFTIGWLTIIFAVNVEMIYFGRFMTGLAGGAFCISAPMYTSEIAEKEIRGALGSYFQLLLTAGVMFAYLIATFVDVKTYTIICALIPIVFFFAFILQPETPFYLLKNGRVEDARKSLIHMRGKKYDVDLEIKQITKFLQEEEKNKAEKFFVAVKKTAAKKAILISFGLMFFQQVGGIKAMTFYMSEIFKSADVHFDTKLATTIVGIIQFVTTFASSVLVDKYGRKILLFLSGTFMCLSQAALGLFFTLKDYQLVSDDVLTTLEFLPVLALAVFLIAFSLGYGPIPWFTLAEVIPPEIKTQISAAAGTFSWLQAFVVTKFYLNLTSSIGYDYTSYIFACVSLGSIFFAIFYVIETKGKPLDQIQRELSGIKETKSLEMKAQNGEERF